MQSDEAKRRLAFGSFYHLACSHPGRSAVKLLWPELAPAPLVAAMLAFIVLPASTTASAHACPSNPLNTTVTFDGSCDFGSENFLIGNGDGDTGNLTIQNGGTVSNLIGAVGVRSGSVGTVTVTGTNSAWTNSSDIYVGSDGAGTLIVADGGTVTSNRGFVGYSSRSDNTVTVTGSDSAWTIAGNLTVGTSGIGALTISGGGSVSANVGAGTAEIGTEANGVGTLNIGAAVSDSAAGPGTLSAAILNFSAGSGTLVFNHTASAYTFNPAITGGSGVAADIKQIAGTTMLTGDSSGYAGTTTVSGGSLMVNNMLGSTLSTLTVASGGTLGGTGGVGGAVTVQSGGTLSPAQAPAR